jgi:SAM-dependent methyltransferase
MLFLFLLLFIILCFWFFSLAPYVPTKTLDLERINKILNLSPRQTFYEIWCGDAKVCHFIAKNNPKKQVTGIEYSLLFYAISKFRNFLKPLPNLHIIYWNALKADFSKPDVFYIFWLTESLEHKIRPKLEKEMHPTARLISYVFEINSWKDRETVYKESSDVLSIYVYQKSL